MKFVDGYVIAVPKDKREAYIRLAEISAAVFKDHGAINIVENWGVDVPDGKLTSFPMAVKLEPNESVVFSWVTWPSRQVRDEGMKRAMEDERFKVFEGNMPFDGARMIFGGFETIVEE